MKKTIGFIVFVLLLAVFTNAESDTDSLRSELKKASGAAPGIKPGTTFLGILNDISERIPVQLQIKVDRIVFDQDGIQLRGTTDNFNTVDSIKKGLESSDKYRDVTIASANLDKSGKGVRFEIKMTRTL